MSRDRRMREGSSIAATKARAVNCPTTEAVELVARTEGILLDPVYTGKAMASLLSLVRNDAIAPGETVVFWHTGGAPGLFAYPEVFHR